MKPPHGWDYPAHSRLIDRADITEGFGRVRPYLCGTCGPIDDLESTRTIDYDFCADCGSTDVRANDDPRPFRATGRRVIHPHIHPKEIAA